MGSGGSRRFFERRKEPEEISVAIRKAEDEAKDQAFETEIAAVLAELLSEYNSRDTKAISAALAEIKHALEFDIEGSVDPIFGGSVRKHTYVDGISDIDSLIALKDAVLQSMTPQEALDYFEAKIREKLPGWQVARGRLAVTVTRNDLQIQLLPAVKQEKGIAIASANGDAWSKINPDTFFRQLARINERRGSKVVPTIKLAKLINETLPEPARLSGYHIESLAIEAFKSYSGPLTAKAMLKHLLEDARSRVLSPILDKTGQSVYVDEYLGPSNSQARKVVSETLDRVLRRIKNADASRSKEQWLRILGEP
jgi:SMODS domain-containing protein